MLLDLVHGVLGQVFWQLGDDAFFHVGAATSLALKGLASYTEVAGG
jgi:hypothetical protein